MIELERSLAELADRMQIPGGDRLISDVVRRIGEPAQRPARRTGVRLAGALAAVLIVAIVALPGPRHAVARWFGFESVRIEPGVTVPATAVQSTTAGTTTVPDPAAGLGLGPSVSLDEAMSRTSLPDPTPRLLGEPRSVHVVQPPASGQIVVVYAQSELVRQSPVTGVGALVSVMPATLDEGFFRKALGDEATVQAVDVGGAEGFWIEGSPHQLMFQFGDQIDTDILRLATNTLLWERGGFVYRVEADVSLETAMSIAASVA
jgi:hypothetical protein